MSVDDSCSDVVVDANPQDAMLQADLGFLAKTGDGVCAVSPDQRIVMWNAAAVGIMGYEPEQAQGRHCFDVFRGRDECDCVICRRKCHAHRLSGQQRAVPPRDVCVVARNGSRKWLSVSTIPAPEAWRDEVALIHLFRDIDAGKCLELAAGTLVSETHPSPIQQFQRSGRERGRGPRLTPREGEILKLMADGCSTTRIAGLLGVTPSTVRNHVQSMFRKLHVHSRLEAVSVAMRSGLLSTAAVDG